VTLTPLEERVRELLNQSDDLEQLIDDNGDEWHIEHPDRPGWSFCGGRLYTSGVPSAEVPEEETCKVCLEVERKYDS
jgi:hypothetical protein